MIRTVIYAVDSDLPLVKLPNHPRRQGQKLSFAVVATSNAGLVGYDQQEIVKLLRVATQFKDTLLEMEHLRRMDICALEINHSVSIQEEGFGFANRHTAQAKLPGSRRQLARRNRGDHRKGASCSKRQLNGIAKRMT